MQFWFSGELDAAIADLYRDVRKEVEGTLNSKLGDQQYGDVIEKISIIPMILGANFAERRKERRLIKRAERLADYRLFIDFHAFVDGTNVQRRQLLVQNLLASIDDIDRKLKGNFDGARLRADVVRLFPIAGS